MKKHILLAGAAAGLALAATTAQAQSIDYGSLEQLFNEPVTTSATGSPQRSTEAPVDMTIISAEDIKRSGAADIPTILSRVAGVDILPFAAGASEISVRGYNQSRSPRMLVLINGRQVYLDHFGYTDWHTLPVALEEIRQIELVRGPNSALFGFNAVSGVVNIITFNPKFDATNLVSVQAGTLGYNAATVVKTLKLGEMISVRLSAGTDRQDEWANTNPAITPAMLSDPWGVRASVDAVAELSPKADLRVEGSWSNSGQSEMLSGYTYARHRVQTSSGKVSLDADTAFGTIQAQAYVNNLDSRATPLHYRNTISVAKVQDLLKIGTAHTLRLGLEYRDNKVNTTPVEGAEVGYSVWAPSVMWNWVVNPKLSVTSAVRLDSLTLKRTGVFPRGMPRQSNSDWDRSIEEVSVNLGAVFAATDRDTFRATYARGVQAPTLVELGSRQVFPTTAPPVGIATVGNPTLQPAIVTSYGLTYERALPELNARLGVKLFQQLTEDVKSGVSRLQIDVPATATTYAALTYFNIGESEMKGVELSASGKLGAGFRWSADTTYTDITDTPIAGYSPVRRQVAFGETSPKYRSNLAVGWTGGPWTADANVHHVSKFNSYTSTQTLEPVKAYGTFAGRVAYNRADGVTLAVSGQNLLREQQVQAKTTALKSERRILFSVSKTW
ncbi:TonB-dependent siderophore receptor [Phenylobacterium sp.]|uniref:TonB-dependent receptor plug domain-containing protein n=1 Tax=Phenylobacterium sp. TaxID=1871053 RepID=UPI002718B94C|nr:TonB-dependent receptor [Phenylobacterium sp.]MDO8800321.1 TonB-dependent receptor [Phenylobacterium sp.]